MTEAEWLAETNPWPILKFLLDKASDRKRRLFATACCRRICHLLIDQSSRNAVDVAERLADGFASDFEVAAAQEAHAIDLENRGCGSDAEENAYGYAAEAASKALGETTEAYAAASYAALEAEHAKHPWDADCDDMEHWDMERWKQREAIISLASDANRHAQIRLLHDIFGNPFRHVNVNPSWLTSTVARLAEGIYTDRAFDRLPILADALQDAGCDNADILSHCRSDGPHVRGCWVVDLLLGKQ